MGRTFIQRVLNALFNGKKEDNAISEAGGQAATSDKTTNPMPKANIKEKHKPETEAEIEEKIRSCAGDIKSCIDLINNNDGGGGAPGKSKGDRGRTNVNNRKAYKSAGNRKASDCRNTNKSTKRSKQGVSPAEMVILLAKAEKKLSKAVVEAKEKDDKKRKGTGKKSI